MISITSSIFDNHNLLSNIYFKYSDRLAQIEQQSNNLLLQELELKNNTELLKEKMATLNSLTNEEKPSQLQINSVLEQIITRQMDIITDLNRKTLGTAYLNRVLDV